MNPGVAIGLVGFSLGVLACCIVGWGLGPGSRQIDAALATLDTDGDDLMAVADAVQDIDQPVPYTPVEFPLADAAEEWLRGLGAES